LRIKGRFCEDLNPRLTVTGGEDVAKGYVDHLYQILVRHVHSKRYSTQEQFLASDSD
jgi:hypothetical protein